MAVLNLKRWNIAFGDGQPLAVVIAGLNVLEDETLALDVGRHLKAITAELGLPYIFKASFDKANRSSIHSYRGPGLKEGLRILAHVKAQLNVPICTDLHEESQAEAVAAVAELGADPRLPLPPDRSPPAAVKTGRMVNVEKGSFWPRTTWPRWVAKAREFGGRRLLLTERGTTFGYHDLVADMRAIQSFVAPVSRSSSTPPIPSNSREPAAMRSAGQAEFAPVLARAAVAAGADGVFLETRPDPAQALERSQPGPLADLPALLRQLRRLFRLCHA